MYVNECQVQYLYISGINLVVFFYLKSITTKMKTFSKLKVSVLDIKFRRCRFLLFIKVSTSAHTPDSLVKVNSTSSLRQQLLHWVVLLSA